MLNIIEKQALRELQIVTETLPDRLDAAMQLAQERQNSIDPENAVEHTLLRIHLAKEADDVFGIIREGPDRGSNRHINALKDAGIEWAGISDITEVQRYYAVTQEQGDRLSNFREKLDARYAKAMKYRGKEFLMLVDRNGLHPTPERLGEMVFMKHGLVPHKETIAKTVQAINEKNLPYLYSLIGANSQNTASEEIFTRLTGVSLGKTQKERIAQLNAWAGPEVTGQLKNDQVKRAITVSHQWLRSAYAAMKSIKVGVNEPTLGGSAQVSGQEYLMLRVSQGFLRVYSQKEGAATVYRLRNEVNGRTSGPRSKEMTKFCKAVLEISPEGDLPGAMGAAGIPVPELP